MKILILVLLISPTTALCQSARLSLADNYYSELAYFKAKEAYEDVLERRVDSLTVAHKIGDCYNQLNDAKKTVEWYGFLNSKSQLTQSELLEYAKRLRDVKDYPASLSALNQYKGLYGSDASTRNLQFDLGELSELEKNKFEITLQEVSINTPSSEIGAHLLDDNSVLIASNKRSGWLVNRQDDWTGEYFYELSIARVKDKDITKSRRLKGDINTKFHDGPACVDSKTDVIYFTRNNRIAGKTGKDDGGVVRLKIYKGTLDGRKVKNVEELSFNSDAYSCAHPALDESKSRLYFSSDMPGGMGGSDIYYVELKKDGSIGNAINAGEVVNTSENEYFPVFHQEERFLYFSSDGHKGLGGLDVYFSSVNEDGTARQVKNIGSPVNSNLDDFSFSNSSKQEFGYFCTNRNGNDNVYYFDQNQRLKLGPVVNGTTYDLLTGSILPDATVSMVYGNDTLSSTSDSLGRVSFDLGDHASSFDLEAKANTYYNDKKMIAYDESIEEYDVDLNLMPELDYILNGFVTDSDSGISLDSVDVSIVSRKEKKDLYSFSTNEEGRFDTGVLPNVYKDTLDYAIELSRQGYLTKEVTYSQILDLVSELMMHDKLDLSMEKVEVGKDLGEILGINPIYFDLNSSLIRSDAAIELDKIVKVMQENPEIKIELGSHTDSRDSDKYNMWLSDRRAKQSAKYIVSNGINPNRITSKGYGESVFKVSIDHINSASTDEEKERLHQLNRRTEFVIVK